MKKFQLGLITFFSLCLVITLFPPCEWYWINEVKTYKTVREISDLYFSSIDKQYVELVPFRHERSFLFFSALKQEVFNWEDSKPIYKNIERHISLIELFTNYMFALLFSSLIQVLYYKLYNKNLNKL